MIHKHLLSAQMLWVTFMKILMIITQKERKKLIVFDDMIADIMKNKKLQVIKNYLLDAEN